MDFRTEEINQFISLFLTKVFPFRHLSEFDLLFYIWHLNELFLFFLDLCFCRHGIFCNGFYTLETTLEHINI